MKNLIIRINDVMCYIVIGFVILTAFLSAWTGAVFNAVIILVVGMVICALFFGLWFAVSSMQQEAVKQTALLNKLLDK